VLGCVESERPGQLAVRLAPDEKEETSAPLGRVLPCAMGDSDAGTGLILNGPKTLCWAETTPKKRIDTHNSRAPRVPRRARKPLHRRTIPPREATNLSRRRPRVRVPSLPFLAL
jgi:hypothetical protein